MADSRPTYVWSGIEWVAVAPGIGVEGGVTDHAGLTGLADPGAHPIEAIEDLQNSLDSKASVTHNHPGLNIQAGDGIDLSNGDPNVITNTDLGTVALESHTDPLNTDPHSGIYSAIAHGHTGIYAPEIHVHDYSPEDHLHDGTYSPDTHEHSTLYLPLIGGSMEGPLLLTGALPSSPEEAVSQQWVLDQISISGVELISDSFFDSVIPGVSWDDSLVFGAGVNSVVPTSPLLGNAAKTLIPTPGTDGGAWQQVPILVPPGNVSGMSGYIDCSAAVGNGSVRVFALWTDDGSAPIYGSPTTNQEEISSIQILAGQTITNFNWQWNFSSLGPTQIRLAYLLEGDTDGAISNTEVWLDNCFARWESQADLNVKYGCSLYRTNNVAMTGSGIEVVWGTNSIDEGGYWDVSQPTKGIRIPPGLGGLYRVTWGATFSGGTDGSYRQHTLRLNSVGAYRIRVVPGGTGDFYCEGNRVIRLSDGDYLDTQINNAGATNPTFIGTTNAVGGNVFEAWKL